MKAVFESRGNVAQVGAVVGEWTILQVLTLRRHGGALSRRNATKPPFDT